MRGFALAGARIKREYLEENVKFRSVRLRQPDAGWVFRCGTDGDTLPYTCSAEQMLLGGTGITIGFPAAAAGEVAARIFDKAHHIVERIAQKYADLMGEISSQQSRRDSCRKSGA
mgnify:CR=1 FL=1